jgi:hypothetical protein
MFAYKKHIAYFFYWVSILLILIPTVIILWATYAVGGGLNKDGAFIHVPAALVSAVFWFIAYWIGYNNKKLTIVYWATLIPITALYIVTKNTNW